MKATSAILFAALIGSSAFQPMSGADAATYKEKVLYSFCSQHNCADGEAPFAGLIDMKGTLYGTTSVGGANGDAGSIFAFNQNTRSEVVIYSFCSQANCADGAEPNGLMYANGVLYGTTNFGGAKGCNGVGCGTAFSLDSRTGAERVLHSFCTEQNCADGASPFAGLSDANGILYGTTQYGGAKNGGVVFALNRQRGGLKVLHSFCSEQNCGDGQYPDSALINLNGTLFGTTLAGGANDTGCNYGSCGTVFSLDPRTGTTDVLHSFGNGADGANPEAGLTDVDGRLYGVTMYGGTGTGCGTFGCGSVFSLDPNTGTEAVVYSFVGGEDGAGPDAALIEVKGELYGTTPYGGGTGCGGYGCGIVFSVDPNTGSEKMLYIFCSQANCADGAEPNGLMYANGVLYGTTIWGGANGYGTVFALKQDG